MSDPAVVVRGLCVELLRRRVLSDVSLDAPAGGFTAVVGPNGSGKTTLLRALYRSVEPSAGTIHLEGAPLGRLDRRTLGRTLAVLRQSEDLEFEFTVEELVLMGRSPYKGLFDPDRPEDLAIVQRAMEETDVVALAHRSFDQLSGGEKQRVLLARALAQEPRILLLDEPTNHLDVGHQLEVLSCVKRLGLTVIAALHDLQLALTFGTHVVLLSNGRVASAGTPEAVLTPDAIHAVFGVKAERVTGVDGGSGFVYAQRPRGEAQR